MIKTTTYFDIVKNAYQTIYGNNSQDLSLNTNQNIDVKQPESQINVIGTK